MNLTFQAMKRSNAVSANTSDGMLRCSFIVRNAQESASVDTSQRMHPLPLYMRLGSTTSSVESIIQVAEIKSSSKDMPAQECMPVHF
jgi:hypothetical protein